MNFRIQKLIAALFVLTLSTAFPQTPETVTESAAPMVPRGIPVFPDVTGTINSAGETVKSTPAVVKPASSERPKGESWRNRYELGAGDVLNFGLSGKPKLIALAVPIAPDGTVSYLQAKHVSVLGKTIGELRTEMEKILTSYHREPRVIVTPAKLGSKKYMIMGQVKENGSFPLERPTKLIEAIAKSKGIAVGINDDSAMELADFDRSFVIRNNKKLDVNFEELYLKGDLSQNIQLEPNDYIYIASRLNNEWVWR